MRIDGKEVPTVFLYQDGKLVWDFVLPDGWERGKYGFQKKEEIPTELIKESVKL